MIQRQQWTISLSFLCTLVVLPQVGLAKSPAPKLSSCDRNPECKAANAQAITLFNQQRYPEALRQFQLAYSIVPSENLLLSIGRALFRVNDFAGSIQYLTRFSATAQASDKENRQKLDKFLAEAQARLAAFNQLRDRGLQALAEQRFGDALVDLVAAFDMKQDSELLVAQGKALYGLGRYKEAIVQYQRALDAADAPGRGDEVRHEEVAQLRKDAETAAAAQSPSPVATLPCKQDPTCTGAATQPLAPPLVPAQQPLPPGTVDHDLDDRSAQPAETKPLYKSAALWVGVSLGAAATIAGIVGGIYATKNSQSGGGSAAIYSVSWK